MSYFFPFGRGWEDLDSDITEKGSLGYNPLFNQIELHQCRCMVIDVIF